MCLIREQSGSCGNPTGDLQIRHDVKEENAS